MANWCFNIVRFEGDEQALKDVEAFFISMAAKEKMENRGQLPAFSNNVSGGYFFYTDYKDGVLYYETKYCPNIEVLREVADHFKVGFTSDYSEIDLQVFGQATYKHGLLKDISLDPEDFNLFEYDQMENTWLFEGNSYVYDEEILEILLDRKKAASEFIQRKNQCRFVSKGAKHSNRARRKR